MEFARSYMLAYKGAHVAVVLFMVFVPVTCCMGLLFVGWIWWTRRATARDGGRSFDRTAKRRLILGALGLAVVLLGTVGVWIYAVNEFLGAVSNRPL